MLAKALAKESGAAFINITAASMQSKWHVALVQPAGISAAMATRNCDSPARGVRCYRSAREVKPVPGRGCRYGETSRLVAALFRVARKVAPTIIFIDEVATPVAACALA